MNSNVGTGSDRSGQLLLVSDGEADLQQQLEASCRAAGLSILQHDLSDIASSELGKSKLRSLMTVFKVRPNMFCFYTHYWLYIPF